jgi:hypothetical protein
VVLPAFHKNSAAVLFCSFPILAVLCEQNEIATDPSPTADATRLILPPRTSPTAKTPGKLVSSKSMADA